MEKGEKIKKGEETENLPEAVDKEPEDKNQKNDAPPHLERCGLNGARFLDARESPHSEECGFQDSRHNETVFTKKQNKQIMWVVIVMAGLILALIVIPLITNYFNKFEHIGIDFQKTKSGKLVIYSAKIPITNTPPITGQLISEDEINRSIVTEFRNDPRKLEDIIVELPGNKVNFFKKNTVFITINSNDTVCKDSIVAVVGITGLLKDLGSLTINGAVTNQSYAEENKLPYVTCENMPHNTVIWVKQGNENRITNTSENCYELTFKECELIRVAERFELVILEDYMSYFEKK